MDNYKKLYSKIRFVLYQFAISCSDSDFEKILDKLSDYVEYARYNYDASLGFIDGHLRLKNTTRASTFINKCFSAVDSISPSIRFDILEPLKDDKSIWDKYGDNSKTFGILSSLGLWKKREKLRKESGRIGKQQKLAKNEVSKPKRGIVIVYDKISDLK